MDTCCIGPTGHGIICEPNSECCGGICLTPGLGCAQVCAPGLVRCGEDCLASVSGTKCCENSEGVGVICAESDQCCDGVCVVNGTGCSDTCSPGLVSCGGHCLAGTPDDTCCLSPVGTGIMCDPTAECCSGFCLPKGQGCAERCGKGMVHCGGQCLVGTEDSSCCEGPSGAGIVCELTAECCSGLCVAEGEGCADYCHDGLISCGGICQLGSEEDTCCENAFGESFVCKAPGVCCDGVCIVDGTGCADPCMPGLIKCGGQCMVGEPGDSCCIGPSNSGIVCGPDAECCDGICVDKGLACSENCSEGLVRCGGECLVGSEDGTCCLNSLGVGIMCAAGAQCCDGICVHAGEGCADPCHEGLISCGGVCLPGTYGSTCCEGPTGAGVLCMPDSQCCGGLCQSRDVPCTLQGYLA